jgi:hypothetical protein
MSKIKAEIGRFFRISFFRKKYYSLAFFEGKNAVKFLRQCLCEWRRLTKPARRASSLRAACVRTICP